MTQLEPDNGLGTETVAGLRHRELEEVLAGRFDAATSRGLNSTLSDNTVIGGLIRAVSTKAQVIVATQSTACVDCFEEANRQRRRA